MSGNGNGQVPMHVLPFCPFRFQFQAPSIVRPASVADAFEVSMGDPRRCIADQCAMWIGKKNPQTGAVSAGCAFPMQVIELVNLQNLVATIANANSQPQPPQEAPANA